MDRLPVSIHARVWRATLSQVAHMCAVTFQSTPACGERQSLLAMVGRYFGFNPRPRVASDDVRRIIGDPSNVSIHARVWRATFSGNRPVAVRNVSIHARVWRATSMANRTWSRIPGFNPRPRVASDKRRERQSQADRVSIHARVWRATVDDERKCAHRQVSIHARVWRATAGCLMHP